MKQLLTFILYYLIAYPVFSQSSQNPYAIKGFVVDSSTTKTIAFVKVTLKNVQNITSGLQVTDTDRSFTVHNLCEENDSLSLTHIGHIAKNITIKPNNSGESDLDILLLIPEAQELKEVKITANKVLIKDEVDRIAQKVLSTTPAFAIQKAIITTTSSTDYNGESVGGTINIIYNKARYTWYFCVVWR